jgi:hypothetical protein
MRGLRHNNNGVLLAVAFGHIKGDSFQQQKSRTGQMSNETS